jgi:cytochrome c oxidase subunit 2
MEGIVDLHSDMLFVILSVCFLVSFMLVSIVVKFNNKNNVEFSDCKHHTLLELVWTILPALILIVLAVPSFALLFQTDEYKDPGTIVSVSGNQ